MYWYYSTKVTILVLGTMIPVLTTFSAWSWVIARRRRHDRRC